MQEIAKNLHDDVTISIAHLKHNLAEIEKAKQKAGKKRILCNFKDTLNN